MTAGSDHPTCEVCDERPAEGSFGPESNPSCVCRTCAECAVEDGHLARRDFAWWIPERPRIEPPGA